MQSKLLMINQDTKMSLKRKYNDEDDLKNHKVAVEDLKEKLPKNKFKKYKTNDKIKDSSFLKIQEDINENLKQNSSKNSIHLQSNELSKLDQSHQTSKFSIAKPIENYYNQLNNYNLLINKEKILSTHLLDNNYLQLLNYQNCLMQKSFELNFLPNIKQNFEKNINNSLKNQILKPELNLNNFNFENANFNRPCRRQRTTFTNEQTFKLEIEYRQNEYISRNKRFQLADLLDLTENQIKIWFQNRRAKDKRIEKALLDQQFKFLIN